MTKRTLGPTNLVCPMPVFLVGAEVNGKPNFLTVAWGSVAAGTPLTLVVAINKKRYTAQGIQPGKGFSVNIPSVDMAREVDFCGINSGSRVDKVSACKFKVFYGKTGNAPLIEQCPLNFECTVLHILDLGSHLLIAGKVEETHISENCFTEGKPDVARINPLAFANAPEARYLALGEVIAKAFSVGKEIKTE